MIKTEDMPNTAGGAMPGVGMTGARETVTNDSSKEAASGAPAFDGTGNTTISNITSMEPLIKNQISTRVGVQDTSNILAVRPTPTPPQALEPAPQLALQPTLRPTPQPAPGQTSAFGATATNVSRPVTATLTPKPTPALATTATPTPSPQPPYAVLPESSTLLAKPLSRQDNKPFTNALDPDFNPRTASRDQVRNISGWDRLTTNVIGRSGICSTYMNRTSFPGYINPSNVKLANQFDVMRETLNITHAGSYLQQRMWAL
jgi:hypothetical protein